MFQQASFDENYIEETRQEQRWAGDDKLFVKFSVEPVLNPSRSAEEGRPIYDEREFVTIIVPGNRLASIHSMVDDSYRNRFRQRYNKWKEGIAEAVSGTPLDSWPRVTVSQAAELKALNIHTVEQLASLPDNLADNMMGFYGLKEAAQQFILASQGRAADTKLADELSKRDAEILALQEQVKALMAASSAAKSGDKK